MYQKVTIFNMSFPLFQTIIVGRAREKLPLRNRGLYIAAVCREGEAERESLTPAYQLFFLFLLLFLLSLPVAPLTSSGGFSFQQNSAE